jgi:branched-subunit amino acid ABC-type transport system permease component
MEHIMASAGVPPGVPPIGLLHAARALRIYRRHEINALAWIALGVCLRSPALIAAISVALLIVCAWSLTRHIQYMKPLYELPVFSRLLAHSGMAFAAINAALLAVELATGAGRGAWFDADGWLAPAWPQILPDMAGTIELMLVGAQWIVVLGVVVAATAWAWLSLGGGRSLRFPPRSQ